MGETGERTDGASWRRALAAPWAAGLLCAALALPARALGHEAAQAFRRLVDRVVSDSDALFDYATSSEAAALTIRSVQAWGAWILYGLLTGLLAMALTRLLARRPVGWSGLALALGLWLVVYAAVWPWDAELRFLLPGARLGDENAYGAWPYAGSLGWFGGFALGLILAGAPWAARRRRLSPGAP